MPNRRRGEVALQLGDTCYTLCLTLGALAELEDAFGVQDLMALAERFGTGRLSSRDLLTLLAVALRGGGHALTDADVAALRDSGTVATLLPGVEFSTRSPYPDARALVDAGVAVALATDCNPGSCYTSSMPFVVALAVRELGLTPAEALWAATAGGALALRRTDVGRLVPGARADLAVLDAPTYRHLAYRPGVPIVRTLELPAT